MPAKIYPKNIKGKIYYYYQESYRKKIDSADQGKHKNSGKSMVHTRTIYLGDASTILSWKKNIKGPVSIEHRAFGLLAAAYQTAIEFGLVSALKDNIKGKRFGIDRWLYFFITILNKLDCSTSKNQTQKWAKKTILPDLLDFKPEKLTSKNYWYVTDDIISEAALKKRRIEKKGVDEDLFCSIEDEVFIKIENEIFKQIKPLLSDPARSLTYDTTNFFTFFESPNASSLAKTGHNKESRHHLRQVGLAMAIDRDLKVPFFHRVYRGNSQDASTFYTIVNDLVKCIQTSFNNVEELILVLDKGNNKKETFKFLKDKVEWVGSLIPSQHQDLLDIPIEKYSGPIYKEIRTHCQVKTVMDMECLLIMTSNPKLYRKQEHVFKRGIEKLKKNMKEKYGSYKRTPKKITAGLKTLHDKSRYKKFVIPKVDKTGISFELNEEEVQKQKKRFGKNLLFTSKVDAETGWVITQYKEKDVIEDAFKTMKDPELIRIRPLRHWTDSKIRAYIFCCVMSYFLMRLMQYKACQAGIEMSAKILKEELSDLREVIMIYDDARAERKVTAKSSVQKKLYDLFELEKIENMVTLH